MNIETEHQFISAKDLIKIAKSRIEEVATKDGFSGIASGFEKIDKLTSGWQPSDLIVIAGRSSMGKSSFILSMIRNIAINFGNSVALFSPEMSSIQIVNRLISLQTGLSLSKLITGKLDKHEWEKLYIESKIFEKAPIYINDLPNLSIDEFSNSANKLVKDFGVKVIIIDNLHLMSCGNIGKGNFTREQEISTIVRNLKALAKELEVPIIIIAQLSRENENRGYNKRPILNDLRGSGTIEEIADIVSFIYRPEYYKIEEWDDDEQTPTFGQAEFIIAKHRNGSLDNIRLKFSQRIGEFDNLDEVYYDDEGLTIGSSNNPFFTKNLPSANEAFGSSSNSNDDDSDVPF